MIRESERRVPSEHARIVPLRDEHAAEVLEIYRLGIDGGDATFETEPPTWDRFIRSRLPAHRFVALGDDGRVLGWVACSPVSDRRVYADVVEHSVYVHPNVRGRGPRAHQPLPAIPRRVLATVPRAVAAFLGRALGAVANRPKFGRQIIRHFGSRVSKSRHG
jgi:hypothetical protein